MYGAVQFYRTVILGVASLAERWRNVPVAHRRIGTCYINLHFTSSTTSIEIMQRRVGIAIIGGRRVDRIGKYASFAAAVMERRKSFAQLVLAYADGRFARSLFIIPTTLTPRREAIRLFPPLAPSSNDTSRKNGNGTSSAAVAATTTALVGLDGMEDLDLVGVVEKEERNWSMELQFVKPYLEFAGKDATINSNLMVTCTDEHLMKAHSLLKLSSLLDSRLKVRSHVHGGNAISAKETLSNTSSITGGDQNHQGVFVLFSCNRNKSGKLISKKRVERKRRRKK